MHVGYVLKKFPRLSETFILNEILELERQGVEVTVFSLHRPDDGRFHRRLADLAGAVVYLPVPKSQELIDQLANRVEILRKCREPLWAEFLELLTERRRDLWSVLRWGLEIAFEARRRGIAHLHAHFATVATQVARVAGAIGDLPFSFTCHAKDIYRDGVDAARFARMVDAAAFVTTVCEANRNYILTYLAPGADRRVAARYNGVDLDTFHPRVRNEDPEPFVLGVGRLVEKKGFDDLVRAIASLQRSGRHVSCTIVGDGDRREALKALACELGADVRFAGACTQDETLDHIARATLLALPCVVGDDGNRDALPTVLLEALATGVPVVSTPIVGIEEIVGGGEAGVLVPARDPNTLAKTICALTDDPQRRAQLAERGRARAERLFDIRRNVASLRAAFEQSACPQEALG